MEYGDNSALATLQQSADMKNYHFETAPDINDDYTYSQNNGNKQIRVYDWLDVRLTLDDLYSKMKLCYGKNC